MVNPEINVIGTKYWYDSNGEFHRDDGPAIEYADGDKLWCQHGNIHRDDGPAVEYANGTTEWWQHGVRHRDDGPVIEYADGSKQWRLNHIYLSFDEWLDAVDLSGEDKVMMKLKYG
jgi:hypothetical protein